MNRQLIHFRKRANNRLTSLPSPRISLMGQEACRDYCRWTRDRLLRRAWAAAARATTQACSSSGVPCDTHRQVHRRVFSSPALTGCLYKRGEASRGLINSPHLLWGHVSLEGNSWRSSWGLTTSQRPVLAWLRPPWPLLQGGESWTNFSDWMRERLWDDVSGANWPKFARTRRSTLASGFLFWRCFGNCVLTRFQSITSRDKLWGNPLKTIFRCQEPGDPTSSRAACDPGNWLGGELPQRSPGECYVYSSCSVTPHVCFCTSEPSIPFLLASLISSRILSNSVQQKLQGIIPVWRGSLRSNATTLLFPLHSHSSLTRVSQA